MIDFKRLLIVWVSLLSLARCPAPKITCAEAIKIYNDQNNNLVCDTEESMGEGSSGITFRVKDQQDDIIKILKVQYAHEDLPPGVPANTPKVLKTRTALEIKVMKACDHKNVIKYYGDKVSGELHFLLMEYAELGSFVEFCEKYSEYLGVNPTNVMNFLEQMVQGIDHMHSKGFVHADVKLDNMVLTKDLELKIIDFDLSVEKGTSAQCGRGTNEYQDPDVSCEGNVVYTEKVDVYSLGATLYVMTEYELGQYPMTEKEEMVAKLTKKHVPMAKRAAESRFYPVSRGVDVYVAYLIQWMTQLKASDRPTLQQVLKEIEEFKNGEMYRPINRILLKNNEMKQKNQIPVIKKKQTDPDTFFKFNAQRALTQRSGIRRSKAMELPPRGTEQGYRPILDESSIYLAIMGCVALFSFVSITFLLTVKARAWMAKTRKPKIMTDSSLRTTIVLDSRNSEANSGEV